MLTTLLLLAGMLAPFSLVTPAAAAPVAGDGFNPALSAARRPGTPPPLPEISRVVVAGDFQTQVGCPANWDKTCDITRLWPVGDGTWTGSYFIAPGTYGFNLVVTTALGDIALGRDGLEKPAAEDNRVQVPDGAIGVHFSFNQLTGVVSAIPFVSQAELQTDLGFVPLTPTPDGNFEAFFDAPPGVLTVQAIIDGVPGEPVQIGIDPPGRVYLLVDFAGNVIQAESLQPASLTIYKTDEAGNLLPGACFAVYARDDVASQGCDGDDGSRDGVTTLYFPNGIPPRANELAETLTPAGQAAADDQGVQLGPGQNEIQVFAVGQGRVEPTEPPVEPTEEPTAVIPVGVQVAFVAVDENGNVITNNPACYAIDGGPQRCDDDGDGVVVFDDLQPNVTYTLTQTRDPDGYEGIGTVQFTVPEGGGRFSVPHRTLERPLATGTLVAYAVDQDGNELPFTCFEVSTYGQLCDGDDPDARMTQPDVPPGDYSVRLVVPEGYEPVGPVEQTATVLPGETTFVAFQVQRAVPQPQAGTLFVYSRDEAGNRVGFACFFFEPRGDTPGVEQEICDNDGDGDVTIELAAGRWRVTQTSAPEGYAPGRRQNVDVPAGGVAELLFVNTLVAPQTGTLVAYAVDQDGNELPFTCFEVSTYGQLCDGDDPDARMTQPDVPPGDYSVRLVVPEGYEPVGPVEQTATVLPGETTFVAFQVQRAVPQTGALRIQIQDEDGFALVGACVDVSGPVSGRLCDNDPGDADPADGAILIENMPPGDYAVDLVPPEGFGPAETQSASVAAGEEASVTLVSVSVPQIGNLIIVKQDEAGNRLPGSCFEVDGIAVCDNEAGDADPTPGIIRIEGIADGSYTLSETRAPEGYEPEADRRVRIRAGQDTTVEVTNTLAVTPTPTAAPTGGVLIRKLDQDGRRIAGSCFTVSGPVTVGPVCDNSDGDADPAVGRIRIDGLPVGVYSLDEQPPDGYAAPAELPEVTVEAGEVTRVDVTNTLATGTLIAYTYDQDGNPVPGVCYDVTNYGEVCDQDGDGDMTLPDAPAGLYTVRQTSVPSGYDLADPPEQQGTLEPRGTLELTFISNRQLGTLRILKVDDAGNPLGGACFEVNGTEVCDNDGQFDANPADGVIEVPNVQSGRYTVAETRAPAGYEPATEAQRVDVPPGAVAEVTFVNTLQAGTVRVLVTDGVQPVGGACVRVDDGPEVCDNGDGDADPAEGVIEIRDVPPGRHTVSLTREVEGFAAAEERTVDVPAGGVGEVTVALVPQAGALRILKVDEAGDPLGGACFEVNGAEVCDNEAGDADPTEGVVLIEGLDPGQYEVAESRAPAGYQATTGSQPVQVTPGETTEVTFENVEATGSVRVVKLDDAGNPLGGACFSLDGPGTYLACDQGDGDASDLDGEILFANVAPGDYTLTETQAPEGYLAGAPQALQVAPGQETAVEVVNEPVPPPTPTPTPEPDTGNVEIRKVDPDGNRLPGACFAMSGAAGVGPVCDNDLTDADPADGVIRIEGIPAGDYLVTETLPPVGYTGAADQPVTVQPGQTAAVEFVNQPRPPEIGSVRIRSLNQDGNPVGGACYTIGATAVCDQGPGDLDPAPGEVLVQGLIVGQYPVTETVAPDGYQQNTETQTIEVLANQDVEVAFVHEPLPPETGQVQFELRDPDGNLVPGGCIAISSESNLEAEQEFCDGGPEDLDPRPGYLMVELPVGTYSARQAELPAGAEATGFVATGPRAMLQQNGLAALPGLPAGLGLDEKTFTVRANIIIIIIIIIIIQLPDEGDLIIIKRAEDTNKLQGGACFRVTGPDDVEVCDNDGVDANNTAGIIRINDLQLGTYTVTETQAPPGYDPAPDRTVEIRRGPNTITIKNPPVPVTTGDLIVYKVDEQGNPLPGACFELRLGVNVVIEICDDDDGTNDGTITFRNIEKGTYTLRESRLPSPDYNPAPDQTVTIIAGQTDTSVTVVNTLKPGNILITKLDDQGQGPLPGACFGLDRGAGLEYEVCDQLPGDGDGEEGIIYMASVPAGTWTLIETLAPPGFDPADDQSITVEPGKTLYLEIRNKPAPPPAQRGNLRVFKVDEQGNPLPGACFSLKQGPVTKVPSRCDGADGANDGTITFTNVPVGTYQLHETQKPSAAYQTVPDQTVQIQANQTTTVQVVNKLRPGRILVKKVNQKGHPLQNACFVLSPGDPTEKCTDAAGQVSFENLDPTRTYTLTETKAPPSYQPVPPKTNIAVQPGLTTTLTIVDKKTPPPPDTGSIKVIKFFCPAGKGGEQTVVYDSSDPGTKKLPQTASCTKGNANFRLVPVTGGDPITFSTGHDGEHHMTLRQGRYNLTELATGVTVEVQIFLGQQTTVVVLNFVRPPEPKPATINVIKYTCDPGFGGAYFADFMNNCAEPSALTNGVTFRISGAAAQKRVTGDSGQPGRTSFTQLPAGHYVLEEEPPVGAGTVYGFCGYDPNAPDYKTVDEDIAFNLRAGDVLTCIFFNVPDEVTDTTGAIVVHKYVCEFTGKKRPVTFDWYRECTLQTVGARFALSVRQGETFVPVATGVTNVDGILRFSMLRPGTYQLKEIGADWCHAESDSVDPQGNIIVKAGQRSNVWIFNCVPTKEPPNTGAGTTAGAWTATSATTAFDPTSGGAMLLGLVWPLLGLVVYGWRKRQPLHRAA